MDKLQEILMRKWQEKTLAHFYILRAHQYADEDMEKWIVAWIKSIGVSIDSPDILFLRPPLMDEGQEKNYLNEDFELFFNFLNYRPMELSHRFIVIEKAHLVSPLISNKLLKSLEEPPKDTTIFFLQSKDTLFLKTIESRAIKIRLPSLDAKNLGNTESESHILFSILEKERNQFDNASRKEELLGELKHFELSQRMKNTPAERLFALKRFT